MRVVQDHAQGSNTTLMQMALYVLIATTHQCWIVVRCMCLTGAVANCTPSDSGNSRSSTIPDAEIDRQSAYIEDGRAHSVRQAWRQHVMMTPSMRK